MIKLLLYPIGIVYEWVTRLRNTLYDRKVFVSFEFTLPVVCVGNLRVGGTGKTPMVEYLVRYLLKKDRQPAIISRGYGRKTKGFRLAEEGETARSLGDEPFQYYSKFGTSVPVAVCEERVFAIPQLLALHDEVNVIVLDDAFQHRKVKASLNLLLSSFDQPFFEDHILPVGRLRERKEGASRADIIVFTRCSISLSEAQKRTYIESAQKWAGKPLPVFFTKLEYAKPVSIVGNTATLQDGADVLLLTGIAETATIEAYVAEKYKLKAFISFNDHHNYTPKDVRRVMDTAKANSITKIITTEKDAVKLSLFAELLTNVEVYTLPIEVAFIESEDKFLEEVEKSIRQFD